jgi:hypothetical protein
METQTPVQKEKKAKETVEATIRNIVSLLVDKEFQIFSRDNHENNGIVLTVKAEKKDYGKVVGKEGHTANSIRNILSSVGAKHGFRIQLEVQEKE